MSENELAIELHYNGTKWTDARLRELRRLRDEEGMSYSKIGNILGVSRCACVSAYHRKISHVRTFSRLTKSQRESIERRVEGIVERSVPTVPFIPGLKPNPRYTMTTPT